MTHKEYADSLREIADFFETHQEFPVPYDAERLNYFNCLNRAELAALARALGNVSKHYDADYEGAFTLTHRFGAIMFRCIQNREVVCRKVVTGTKHVEERL